MAGIWLGSGLITLTLLCGALTLQAAYLRADTNRFMTTPTQEINALHCANAGLCLSSICNKTALLFHENNKFDIVKKKDSNSFFMNSEQCHLQFLVSDFLYMHLMQTGAGKCHLKYPYVNKHHFPLSFRF